MKMHTDTDGARTFGIIIL